MMTELLDAVDELTLPQRHREQQDVISDGHVVGTQKVLIEHEPRLTQLAEAVAGAVGAGSSKGSLAFERNPLDADALYKLVRISETIWQWCTLIKVRPTKDLNHDLRAWHAATLPLNWDEKKDAWYADQLHKWAREIDSKLDPWREREYANRDCRDCDACPICGADSWWRDGIEYLHPLVVRYKATGPDMIQQARGLCRACEQAWPVRALAYDVEKRHTDEHQSDVLFHGGPLDGKTIRIDKHATFWQHEDKKHGTVMYELGDAAIEPREGTHVQDDEQEQEQAA